MDRSPWKVTADISEAADIRLGAGVEGRRACGCDNDEDLTTWIEAWRAATSSRELSVFSGRGLACILITKEPGGVCVNERAELRVCVFDVAAGTDALLARACLSATCCLQGAGLLLGDLLPASGGFNP